jgi:predicted membrane protein
MDLGAGDFVANFNEPAEVIMSQMTVRTGASRLQLAGIGNICPERMTVYGGAGDITLDLTGAWQHSAEIKVVAGVGQLTLHVPSDVSVRIDIDGLAAVNNDGLEKRGDDYVSAAYGETESEVNVEVTAGIGNIRLIQAGN